MFPLLRLPCLALLSLSFAAAVAQAQAVYTWKDARGVTHYSDAPPPKGSAKATMKAVRAPTPGRPAAPAAAPATGASDGTTPAEKLAEASAAKNARCSQARANLQALQGSAPVGPDTDGDGKPDSTLDADARGKQLAAMQVVIQRDCSGG